MSGPSYRRTTNKACVLSGFVLTHWQDAIQGFAFGAALEGAIPGARLAELTPKSIARQRHAAEVQGCLDAFLSQFPVSGAEFPPATVLLGVSAHKLRVTSG